MSPVYNALAQPALLRPYIITYDLHFDRRYDELHALMERWGAVRLAESVWLAYLYGTAPQIRNFVTGTIDNDDSVAVIELVHGSDWATERCPAGADWLSRFVTVSEQLAA